MTVRSVSRETRDTVTLRLAPEAAFEFRPGQFNMLYAFGVGEVPISITGDPEKPRELVHTVREVGAVSAALLALKRGASVGIRGPLGTGWPVEECEGRHALVIAGGVGLAPLRSAILYLLRKRRHRRLTILYGARTPGDLLFRRDLADWRRVAEVGTTVDRAGPEWTGRVGVVPALLSELEFEPKDIIALVCGPEVMMRFTARELEGRGIAAEQVHLSLERNMKCGIGLCGHCQLSSLFVCKDGPVVRFDRARPLLEVREL